MQTRNPFPRAKEPDNGVSEVIGAILLISVVIAAVAIVGVFLLSQTTPQKVPDISFMTGYDASHNQLYIYHNGGDTLTTGTFSVLINGTPTKNFIISDYSNEWSLGKNLIVSGVPPGQNTVAITYNTTGGGAVVLRSATSSNVSPVTAINNPDIIPASAYPPVVSIPQLMQNVTSRTIIFYRERNTTIVQSPLTFLNFTITMPNSTISSLPTCGSNPFNLAIGDNISIIQKDSTRQGFRVAGIGNQIWELSADYVDLNIQSSSGTIKCSLSGAIINQTMITGYTNFRTDLSISTGSPVDKVFTSLTKYNYLINTTPQLTSQLINGADINPIVITNISPTSTGFFVFQFDNATRGVYFAGNTTQVIVNSVQVYP
jgi:flagellin-like protein